MELVEFLRKCEVERRAGLGRDAPMQTPSKARSKRHQQQQSNRCKRRENLFNANRNLNLKADTPPPRVDPVKQKLEMWQAEKRRRKQMMPKPLPPFKPGSAPSLTLPPAPPVPPTHRRDTRAARKALRSAASCSSYVSFAPPGAQFRPPIIRKAQKSPQVTNKSKSKTSLVSIQKAKRGRQTPKHNATKAFSRNKFNKTAKNPFPTPFLVNDVVDIPSARSDVIQEKIINFSPSTDVVSKECEVPIGSPFVSVLRGKHRLSVHLNTVCTTSPEKSANYFRLQLDGEISRLLSICEEWKEYNESHEELIEDHKDMIDVAVGQTKLLINKKFQQFKGLIEKCENPETSEEVVKIQDLQGFWDMIYMQVENLDIRFNELKNLKNKNWKEEVRVPQITKNKKPLKLTKNVNTKSKSSGGLRAMIEANRLKAKKENSNLISVNTENDDVKNFNGGFFSVTSPLRQITENKLTPSRSSIHKSVLSLERNKRLSKTPLNITAVLTASSISKNMCERNISPINSCPNDSTLLNLIKTPAKSILKTPNTNKKNPPVNGKNIKVLFANIDCPMIDDEIIDISSPEVKISPGKEEKSTERSRKSRRLLNKYNEENTLVIEPQVENHKERNRNKNIKNSDNEYSPFDSGILNHQQGKKKLKLNGNNVNLKVEPSRLSFNLISFESPTHTYMTRSLSKK